MTKYANSKRFSNRSIRTIERFYEPDIFKKTVSSSWGNAFPDHDTQPIPLFVAATHLARAMERFHYAILKPEGHTFSEFVVLNTLFVSGPADGVPPKELGSILSIESASLAQIVKRLATRGLVERIPNENDRRSVNVRLTEDGISLVKKLSRLEIEAQKEAMSLVKGVETDAIINAMLSLIRALNQIV